MTFAFRAITAAAAVAALAGTTFAQFTGPSSSQSPYLLPAASGVSTTSILTVGDSIGGYRMVGIPDGLGAFAHPGGGAFTLVMNHELQGTAGIARAHGQTGAFVSRWSINNDLTVTSGRDHNTSAADAYEYNSTTGAWSNAPSAAQRWSRFCSGDLAGATAFYNPASGAGTQSRIYLNGEENGAEGRAYAHILTGSAANQTWQLPSLGRFSWENSVANSYAQQKTLVMGMDDSTPGEVYMYIGNKTTTGNDIERAGLTNGNLYGIAVQGLATEGRGAAAAGRFNMVSQGNVTNSTGAQLQTSSSASNVTKFLRPEDGAWDPRPGHENEFYFVTTDRYNQPGQQGNSRLYKMTFDDINNPENGGTITSLVDGFFAGPQMMDNICVDTHGRILIQEDIGGNNALGKVWLFDTNTNNLGVIAQHDAARFGVGGANFLTNDEEASGIIDAKDILGDGWYLLDVQAHYGISGELVEGGQLLAMYVDPSIVPAPGALALLGAGGLFAARRRR